MEFRALAADVLVKPEVTGSARCTIGSYHMFPQTADDRPCHNCGRDFCHEHRAKHVESELLPGLCNECGTAYRAEGVEGLKRVKERVFRVHGS